MPKFIISFLLCLITTPSLCQAKRKISTYLLTQYTHTLYDYTANNNPWGIGVGLQAFLNNNTKFKPTIDFTGDVYLEDDKVLRLNPDGSFPEENTDVRAMVNLFAGVSYHPTKAIYFSLVAGTSFIGGHTLIGIKPSVGFYFSENKRWTGKVSYINVYDRYKYTKDDFGSVSLSFGIKLL